MIILTQNKKTLINADNINSIEIYSKAYSCHLIKAFYGVVSNIKYSGTVSEETILGTYDNKKTALDIILKLFDAAKNNRPTFEMP